MAMQRNTISVLKCSGLLICFSVSVCCSVQFSYNGWFLYVALCRIFVVNRSGHSLDGGQPHDANNPSIPGTITVSLETPPKWTSLLESISLIANNVNPDVLAELEKQSLDDAKPQLRILVVDKQQAAVDKYERVGTRFFFVLVS